MSGPQVGPVFGFTAKHTTTGAFYRDVVGLAPGRDDNDPSWLTAGNADPVFQSPEDREAPQEVRAESGFVGWSGVDDVKLAFEEARTAKYVIGDCYGDCFFARDPEGRYIRISPERGARP